MSLPIRSITWIVIIPLGVSVFIILIAVFLGIWLGKQNENRKATELYDVVSIDILDTAARVPAQSTRIPGAAFYLALDAGPASHTESLLQEAQYARQSGIQNFILDIGSLWSDIEQAKRLLSQFIDMDSEAQFVIRFSLTPSASWSQEHPESVSRGETAESSFVSPFSADWLRISFEKIELLHSEMSPWHENITGYMPGHLIDQSWLLPDYDHSEAGHQAFQLWLQSKYEENNVLQTTWNDESVTFSSAETPEPPDSDDTLQVFFNADTEQHHVDYLSFCSQQLAQTLEQIAHHIKQTAGEHTKVWLPYGYGFESVRNAEGHIALSCLLSSTAIDGFVSPFSYNERGRGGAGGFMGPLHSVLYRNKEYLLIDDTRTGITHDMDTGRPNLLQGLRLEDVYRVQQRNFSQAMTNGVSLAWADPDGHGALLDHEMWRRFHNLIDIYITYWQEIYEQDKLEPPEHWNIPYSALSYSPENEVENEVIDTIEEGSKSDTVNDDNTISDEPIYAPGTYRPVDPRRIVSLCVILDETSRTWQRCDRILNERLLLMARDSIARSGTSTTFCLLDDFLENNIPPAAVYVFLNAFSLSESQVKRIHGILEEKQACAVWMYAPGYIRDGVASADHISATTRFNVHEFNEPAQSGSVCQLDATLINTGEWFGETNEWSPLFYVKSSENEDITVLANFRQTEQPSVVMKIVEEGWTSVYFAEPTLEPIILRQILLILDEPVYLPTVERRINSVATFGPNLIAVHGTDPGVTEGILSLGTPFDIQDLLDTRIGWSSASEVTFDLGFGVTRMFALTSPTTSLSDIP